MIVEELLRWMVEGDRECQLSTVRDKYGDVTIQLCVRRSGKSSCKSNTISARVVAAGVPPGGWTQELERMQREIDGEEQKDDD